MNQQIATDNAISTAARIRNATVEFLKRQRPQDVFFAGQIVTSPEVAGIGVHPTTSIYNTLENLRKVKLVERIRASDPTFPTAKWAYRLTPLGYIEGTSKMRFSRGRVQRKLQKGMANGVRRKLAAPKTKEVAAALSGQVVRAVPDDGALDQRVKPAAITPTAKQNDVTVYVSRRVESVTYLLDGVRVTINLEN